MSLIILFYPKKKLNIKITYQQQRENSIQYHDNIHEEWPYIHKMEGLYEVGLQPSNLEMSL